MTATLDKIKLTPMMAQWQWCKEKAGEAVLFFRMGDFYEAFYDDAITCAKELEVTLTKRQGTPMAGVPHHSADNYIDRLVAKGYRVAVAEQVEDPKQAKGLVKREIVRVVSPGTVVNSKLISEKSNNYFASITIKSGSYGLAFLDLTTGEFQVIEFSSERELLNEVYRIRPSEYLISHKVKDKNAELFDEIRRSYSCLINTDEDWYFEQDLCYNALLQHFKVHNLDGFGLKGMSTGVCAAGALLTHLQDHLKLPSEHIRRLQTYSTSDFMTLDRITQQNLELTESLQDGSRRCTLLEVLDKTQTPMGGRLLRNWVKQPLLSVLAIQQRQDAIEALLKKSPELNELSILLRQVRDLERLMMKVSAGYANPRDLLSLSQSLKPLPSIKTLLEKEDAELISQQLALFYDFGELVSLVEQTLSEDPPARQSDGNIIREGFHAELDELRAIRKDAKSWLARYQELLKEKFNIKTLKVGYNKVFGYYIEVSKGQADRMPDSFQRRQTLVNSERFISPELKDYEHKVLTAQDRIAKIESDLFIELRGKVAKFSENVLTTAGALAHLDCLMSLASVALERDYIRPIVDESQVLNIQEGRHPVIEASNFSESFVPNSTLLDNQDNRLLIITGPNMAGKSTYIRQVALLCILTQMGSFIPAQSAHIGLVDKVFTRIGASDDLSRGQSTFMVEMTETANILNNVTSRSLVILDEIGRGTSTYDGISIAWAVAEFLLTQTGKQAKTLFATHYWELTKLEERVQGSVNYHVAVRECEQDIIFLRKILKGSTDRSYGIHVARLAGLPDSMIERAQEILLHLEETSNRKESFQAPETRTIMGTPVGRGGDEVQLILFEPTNASSKKPKKQKDELRETLIKLDPNNLTPIQALEKLCELKLLASKK